MVEERGQELLENISKIKKLVHKMRPHASIPHGEFMILMSIEGFMKKNMENGIHVPGIKVSDLSKCTHASAPATSKAIRHLEEKSLIERIADEKDRRVVYIALTDGGNKILEQVKETFDNFVNKTIDKLGEEDTKHLIRISKLLYDIVLEDINNKSNQDQENKM
jgi:DNA-binding MarR family transcriptional regulator